MTKDNVNIDGLRMSVASDDDGWLPMFSHWLCGAAGQLFELFLLTVGGGA